SDALDRPSGEAGAKRRIVEAGEFGEPRRGQVFARRELRLTPLLRELVPRTNGETIVAAVDPIADRCAQFARDRPFQLDRQVGNAAPRVEPVRRGKRLCRTRVEAGAAGSA